VTLVVHREARALAFILAAIQLAAVPSYWDAFCVFQESSSELIFQIARIPKPGNCGGVASRIVSAEHCENG